MFFSDRAADDDVTNAGTVLVTGGSGVVGSNLVGTLLRQGRKVKVLDTRYGRLETERMNQNLEFVGIGNEDLHSGMADKQIAIRAVRGVDIIYHLAINWDGATWKHVLPLADLFDANVRGTLNLLDAARSNGVRQLVFSSSIAVYGETERTLTRRSGERRANEKSACWPERWTGDPGPAYAVLKLTTEKLCLMYHHQHGLPVTVFRLEYVFEGEDELRDGANIHVDDVVEAFLRAELNKKAYGQVFDLAYPTSHLSVRKLQRFLNWKPTVTKAFLEKRTSIVKS